ncbi:MAG: CDP-diacylglycerol--serine O-phosphatidyltransferase [Puniceicoccales bacterium]|jgi:CDP-diacylglycerol--serine O-phosphatidyltransferase|nr:CDP-diacylglycerol--serine O-phosphatidyltransferase [Puniceicoccales bacterium]
MSDNSNFSEKPSVPSPAPKYRSPKEASRIYLLPNLFTAGNMLCGFLSIYSCIRAKFITVSAVDANLLYRHAVYYILGACICDLFDGRVARAAKRESLFGAEFDSIADTVSFGVAPALMMSFLVLNPRPETPLSFIGSIGQEFAWAFAFIYLLCVGIRLARFNVLTNPLVPGNESKPSGGDFIGLPCPTAAGMVASLVLLLTQAELKPENLKNISTLLLPLTLLISYLMVSNIRYPSFKHINWNTRLKIQAFIGVFLLLVLVIYYSEYAIPLVFLAFILNGIIYSLRKKTAAPDDGTDIEDNSEDEF